MQQRPLWLSRAGLGRGLLGGLIAVIVALWVAVSGAAEKPWPIRAADLPEPDPRIVWGRLDNGLRWAVVPNATPPGGASLRLMVEVGSLDEREDERGLVHLLEHMAFRGSARIPPGELLPLLRSVGLSFGADTNARVDFETTVYMLEVPRASAEALDTALFVLAEIAGGLMIPEAELEAERGVVLAEARIRATPRQRLFEQSLAFRLPGTLVPHRLPIGEPEVIRTAPRARLVELYRRFYRPDRMIVAIAGDVDPAAVAERIAAHFAHLPRLEAPPRAIARTAPLPRGLAVRVAIEKGLPASLAVSFNRPFDPRPDSRALRAEALAEFVVTHALERRLERIAARPEAPFTSAGMATDSWRDIAEETILRAAIEPSRWAEALATLEQELRRLRSFGVLPEERAEALAVRRAALEDRIRTASTRSSRSLVETILRSARYERVLLAPEAERALFDALVEGIDEAALEAAIARLFSGSGPLIELVLPEVPAMGEGAVAGAVEAAWRESERVAVDPPEAVAAVTLAYAPAAVPAPIIERSRLEALDVTAVQFAGGVRLDVKRTDFEAGTVRVAIRFGRGRLGLPLDKPGLDILLEEAFLAGGLGRHSAEELGRFLADKRIRASFAIQEDALVLTIETAPQHLLTALVLARAQLEDPGLRADILPAWRRRLEATYRRLETVASAVLDGPLARLLNGGDPRFGLPERAEAEARTLAELRAWLAAEIASGPIDVAIVGDVDPEDAIDAVSRTLAHLNASSVALPAPLPPATIPTGSVAFTHGGAADQALLLVYQQTTDGRDPRRALGLELLADVLRERVRTLVRERLGATYAPRVAHAASLVVPDRGRLVVQLDLPVDRIDEIRPQLHALLEELRGRPIGAEELARVLEPRLARLTRLLASNGFWLDGVLSGRHQHPFKLARPLALEAELKSFSAAELAALAARYLDPQRRLEVRVLPRVQG